jgi:hypothetical protein
VASSRRQAIEQAPRPRDHVTVTGRERIEGSRVAGMHVSLHHGNPPGPLPRMQIDRLGAEEATCEPQSG